jgi:hypothetical protein
MQTYLKLWGNDPLSIITDHPIISVYKLPGIKTMLRTICTPSFNPSNMYVVCPQYSSCGKIIDIQFTITGSVILGETFKQAAEREIMEETGIFFPKIIPSVYRLSGKKSVQNFYCQLDNTASPIIQQFVTPKQFVDDRTKKIQVLIYGHFSILEKLFSEVKMPLPSDDTDCRKECFISGIRLIPFSFLMEKYSDFLHHNRYD